MLAMLFDRAGPQRCSPISQNTGARLCARHLVRHRSTGATLEEKPESI